MGSKETLTAIRKQRTAVQKAIRHREEEQDRAKAIVAEAKAREAEAKQKLTDLTNEAMREIEAENQDAIDNPTPTEKPEPAREWAA